MVHSQTIETYGRHAWPILLFGVVVVLYPLLVCISQRSVNRFLNETPDFINPTLWPPNSPDLNPVDYKIWGCMQEIVYKPKVRDVEDLRKRIVQAFTNLDQ